MTTGATTSFLVFSGGNDRAVFGFLRALRLCGQHAHIVARTPRDRILRSGFRNDVRWVRPTHPLTLEIFADCVRRVRTQAGDIPLTLLPSTEYFNTFLLRYRKEIEDMGCRIPLVSADLYSRLTGKRSAAKLFSDAGVSTPDELSDSNRGFPIVAKPVRNVSANGRSLYPYILSTQVEFDAFLATHEASNYFLQEHVQGDSLYLLFHLPKNEGNDFIWSQRNLLQQPGGKSMLLAEASDFHHSKTATRIVSALRKAGFYGIGMVEVIRGQDRDVFIEMNPRIWGPAQFCLDQGQYLLQAFIGDALHGEPMRFTERLPSSPRKHYFWLGGLLDTIASGQAPVWHAAHTPLLLTILRNLSCDVYMRKDSLRCFIDDLVMYLKWRMRHERH